jgi:hypothetical protein
MLSPKVKKFLWITLVVFIIYMVIVSPQEAANIVRSALDKIGNGLNSVGTFATSLMRG